MLDFTELPTDGNDLELLTRELLFSRGYRVNWAGRGPDGGRDLLCDEPGDPVFGSKYRPWLVQCKHRAHSGVAVGVNDLGDIIDSCAQHGAQGYLLVCSTFPSSAVVERLEGIETNRRVHLHTTYWDAPQIERLLSNPRDWPIAQRFFPISGNADGWRLWASELPNRCIATFRGYRFHLTNRIGSWTEGHLESVGRRIDELEQIGLPAGHELRPRAVYYDDKHGTYVWYIDYMMPGKQQPALSMEDLKARLGHETALDDGQLYIWDIAVRPYNALSDHFDRDHYTYYEPYLAIFQLGVGRLSIS